MSVDQILTYTLNFATDIHHFLENWFSDKDSILVKTSGSTGTPKSIVLQKKQMINSALATGKYFDVQQHTKALLCLPIEYIAGKMMLIRALTLGWHLDIIDANSSPLENIKKEYDFSAMVPLQLENSIDKLHFIKKLIVGGGVVSKELQAKIQNSGCAIFATYGMTETITHIAAKQLNNNKVFTSSKIEKSEKNKVDLVSFYQTLPNVKIYKDQRNCLVIDAPKVAEQVLFTNDVIELVSDTHFKWLGRFDNVINSGGVKLHPELIEEKLIKIIKNRFFVVGIKDEKLGEKLVLILEDVISSIEEKSLLNKIRNLNSLSKFEKPKEIYFAKHFIETKTGKIQRIKTLQKIFAK
ncbi:AMP-binding protein [Polaribacter porphyrae]|uniref:AMP-binding protein n=1 Tax=Polaribacter porphyrae TaxID=1137780 RepID=UPI00293D5A60|nr:AMP-binding protein [Polaribacter porphyrae]